MKKTLIKLAVGLLLGFFAISPLRAQTNTPVEADTNHVNGYSEDFERYRAALSVQSENNRLENEKAIADVKSSAHRMMVHDIAWNSWILILIAYFAFAYLKDKRRHETIQLMVEKGAPLTPELLEGLRRNRGRSHHDPFGYLCRGMILVAVALAFFISRANAPAIIFAAWILLAVGVAHLLLWGIDRIFGKSKQ